MLFHALSPVIICLWSLLVAIGPIYTIPALISPVLTPLLSPADGPTILILTEVCDAAVPITFPVCDPSGAPVPPSGSPGTLFDRLSSSQKLPDKSHSRSAQFSASLTAGGKHIDIRIRWRCGEFLLLTDCWVPSHASSCAPRVQLDRWTE